MIGQTLDKYRRLKVNVQKTFIEELSKPSPFYTHCITILHNAAKSEGLIDGNPIEDKRLDYLKMAFSLAFVMSSDEHNQFKGDEEKVLHSWFGSVFYAGMVSVFNYNENTIDSTDFISYLNKQNIDKANKFIKMKYRYNISHLLFKSFEKIINELLKVEYANSVNLCFAVEAFFQLGVTLASYEK